MNTGCAKDKRDSIAVAVTVVVLALVLAPVFSRCGTLSRETTCVNNLRQIASAVRLYAIDHDQVLPMCFAGFCCQYHGEGGYPYPQELAPYMPDWAWWLCPSQDPPPPTPAANAAWAWSYMANAWYWALPAQTWTGTALGKITDPGNVIMFGDALGGPLEHGASRGDLQPVSKQEMPDADQGLVASPPYWPHRKASSGPWCAFVARHEGLANFNFVDGHVGAMSLDRVAKTKARLPQGGEVFYYLSYGRRAAP